MLIELTDKTCINPENVLRIEPGITYKELIRVKEKNIQIMKERQNKYNKSLFKKNKTDYSYLIEAYEKDLSELRNHNSEEIYRYEVIFSNETSCYINAEDFEILKKGME